MTLLPMYRMSWLTNQTCSFSCWSFTLSQESGQDRADTLIAHVRGLSQHSDLGQQGQKAGSPGGGGWGEGWPRQERTVGSCSPLPPFESACGCRRKVMSLQSQDDLVGAGDHLECEAKPVPGRERKSSSPRGTRSMRGGQWGEGNAVSGVGSHPQTHLWDSTCPPGLLPSPPSPSSTEWAQSAAQLPISSRWRAKHISCLAHSPTHLQWARKAPASPIPTTRRKPREDDAGFHSWRGSERREAGDRGRGRGEHPF